MSTARAPESSSILQNKIAVKLSTLIKKRINLEDGVRTIGSEDTGGCRLAKVEPSG